MFFFEFLLELEKFFWRECEVKKPEVNISVKEVVGGGYDEFWRSKQRYVVCKGSRASKKSTTAALKLIVRLMQMPLANALVVRQTAATLSNSCYAQLKWAINRLGVEKYWKCTVNPLQMTYLPTGQKIIFRGCDDSYKITSIAVERGHLCFAWCEEAAEINEDDFNRIDESLRGQLPEGYYIQWILTLNPWSSSCWIKARFFDKPSKDVLAMTTTYRDNEFLSENDLALFKEIERTDPDRAKVVCFADWGIESGQYFSMWRDSVHVVKPFKIPRDWVKFRAMDFGQAKPYAVIWFAVDYDGNMFAYRELYGWGGKPNVGTGETARQIGEKIVELEKAEEDVYCGWLDSACWARTGVTGPTIAEEINSVLAAKGLIPFIPSSKGRLEGANLFKQRLIGNQLEDGSYKPAIQFFSTCIHCLRTIPMIGHDKHKPELPDTDAEDHCFVAGTLIHTFRGEIPIEEVTTEDEVLTRKGFRKVLAAGMTKRSAKVITATFSNGKFLTGTRNHPVFVRGKGFIPLDTVKYGDIIYHASEVDKLCQENKPKQPNQSYSTVSRSGVIPTLNICQIENTTKPTGVFTYTERFGSFTTAKFPKAIMCTTKTVILSITIFLIWNYLKEANTFRNMCGKIFPTLITMSALKTTWKLLDQKPPSGTGQKKEENGIANTGLNVQNAKLKSQKSNAFVSNAAKNSIRQAIEEIAVSIAPPHVVQNTGVTTGLTMKPESAQSAAKNSESIVSAKPKPVAENVDVSVVEIHEEAKKADVYNLTVDEEHEYFANGFLVHNCYDAVAYACLSRPWTPVRKAEERRISDAWHREKSERSAWTY